MNPERPTVIDRDDGPAVPARRGPMVLGPPIVAARRRPAFTSPAFDPDATIAPSRRQRKASTADTKATARLLSAQDAARYLGVPYTSLRDWALRGHLPIVRAPDSRRMWFDRKDLDRVIEQWKERRV
jgi:excisionase family DNA binding protein